MIPMQSMPLASLMFSIWFCLTLAKFAPGYLQFVIAVSAVSALSIFVVSGRYLPRWIMDILDRLSQKATLEKAITERSERVHAIDAEGLADRLKARVVGQDAVIGSIALQLRRRLAARRPHKPVAVFCLAGPPGVGKTHLAKALCDALYGSREHLHFFDMSQFGQPQAAASLFGSAKGYVGSTSYGALTAALRDVPNSIVLLDEFEKAHPDVHKRFLTAWNDGFVTETSDGARVPTNEAIFILTTNAASRRIGEIAQAHGGDMEGADRLIKRALLDAQFAPEVLSRIDQVFAFRPLQGLDIARVVALEMEALAVQFGLTIADGGIDPSILLDAVESLEAAMDGGVRDITRAIEREVTDGFIEQRGRGVASVRLKAIGDRIVVQPAVTPSRVEPADPTASDGSALALKIRRRNRSALLRSAE